MLQQSPSRQRRWRERQRRGERIAPVVFNAAIVDLWAKLNWLSDKDAADRVKVAAAVTKLLNDAAN